jgi:hypothetical protein
MSDMAEMIERFQNFLTYAANVLGGAKKNETVVIPPTEADPNKCAWKDCTNKPLEGRIYCSRACSNSNARYRAALRAGAVAVGIEVTPPVKPVEVVSPPEVKVEPPTSIASSVVPQGTPKKRGPVAINCGLCGVPMMKAKWELARSKSGKLYCCAEHQRIDSKQSREVASVM